MVPRHQNWIHCHMLLTKVKKVLNSRPHHVSNQSNILFKLPKTPAQSKIKGEKRRKKKRKIERKEVATKKEKDYHIHRPLLVFFPFPVYITAQYSSTSLSQLCTIPLNPIYVWLTLTTLKTTKATDKESPIKRKQSLYYIRLTCKMYID